jgi:hypothetical protein
MLDRVDYRQIARGFRESHFKWPAPEETKICRQYKLIFDDLTENAIKYAQDNSLADDDFEYRMLSPIAEFVDEFASAFYEREELTGYKVFGRIAPIHSPTSQRKRSLV